MMTEKEVFLETVKKNNAGKPDRLPRGWSAMRAITGDPCNKFIRGNRIKGTDSYDQWGTFISFPEDQPAAIPIVTPENQVIQDIEEWRSYVKVPDLTGHCSEGWEAANQLKDSIRKEGYLAATIMGTGIFEQMHMLMTFEDTLVNMVMYPKETKELIACIYDYRMTYFRLIVENLHPDLIISHDDWGSEDQMLMDPEMWRDYFKEPYRKIYDYLHENDIIVMHHSDSYCEPIAEDMAEIGVDIWQGVVPKNNIRAISEKLNGRMALMGGISSSIDRADATEEEIRREARRACEAYGDLKMFVPSITYGDPFGTIYPDTAKIAYDEIGRYNKETFGIC